MESRHASNGLVAAAAIGTTTTRARAPQIKLAQADVVLFKVNPFKPALERSALQGLLLLRLT